MRLLLFTWLSLFVALQVAAAQLTVRMYKVGKKPGQLMGVVQFQDTQYGLLITPNIEGLKPGVYGFHLHQNPSCDNFAMAAGGHFDPGHTGKHLGPYNPHGHLGDLPALAVNQQGQAILPILAPRLKVSDLKKHALIIHQGGDNYSDHPEKLGGGGKRMICGVIK